MPYGTLCHRAECKGIRGATALVGTATPYGGESSALGRVSLRSRLGRESRHSRCLTVRGLSALRHVA
jgi:hypothetical protein